MNVIRTTAKIALRVRKTTKAVDANVGFSLCADQSQNQNADQSTAPCEVEMIPAKAIAREMTLGFRGLRWG